MPDPMFLELQDSYDRDRVLASVRFLRIQWAEQSPELADACTVLARRFAERAQEDCPTPAAATGEALLFASSMFAGLLVEAVREFGVSLPTPMVLNMMAMAADDLIGDASRG